MNRRKLLSFLGILPAAPLIPGAIGALAETKDESKAGNLGTVYPHECQAHFDEHICDGVQLAYAKESAYGFEPDSDTLVNINFSNYEAVESYTLESYTLKLHHVNDL